MQYCTEKSWYVLRVRSQAERLVHVSLHHKQFEVLNPTYQALSIRKDRRKMLTCPIFKGYIFVRTLLNSECHLEILKTPGVVEILKSPSGPTPVPDDQVEATLPIITSVMETAADPVLKLAMGRRSHTELPLNQVPSRNLQDHH